MSAIEKIRARMIPRLADGSKRTLRPGQVMNEDEFNAALAEAQDAALAARLDVEEMARIISSHRHGSQVAWDEDRRIAAALRAAILGGAA